MSSGSSQQSSNAQTYEAAKARQFTDRQPDKIHWSGNSAFREEPYRQLHHQNGTIGTFSIRLLEASDLKRSYWSALALGPVRHLGLSKAHGDVSSYCTFSIGFHEHSHQVVVRSPTSISGDQKPAAVPSSRQQPVSLSAESKSSPVVEGNNNPVWDNCVLELPLRKGATESDGMCTHLNVRVDEEATAVESFLPGIIPYAGNRGDRLLGTGQLDLTELLLGESLDGNPVPGVRDEWIPIMLKQYEEDEVRSIEQLRYSSTDPLAPPVATLPSRESSTSNGSTSHTSPQSSNSVKTTAITGMIRVLVSYHPNGLEPEKKDVVALESFARRNLSTCSCRPLLEPLQPLSVVDRRGPYILCEYSLPIAAKNDNHNSNNGNGHKRGRVRLHRNAVFVIERQNFLDAAQNLALLPIDVALATPLGQAACNALSPVISASSELLMPTVLSLKLLWMATRTAGVAGLSGIHALTSTLWREGSSNLLHTHNQQQFNHGRATSNNNVDRQRNGPRDERRTGTAQFVQL